MIFEFQDSSSKDDSRGFSFLDSIASFSLLEREAGDAMANWTWNFISPRMRGRPVAGRKESFPEECNIPAGQEDKECHPHAKLDTKWNSIWQRGNHLSWRPLPITYSAYPAHETWVARTTGGMRLAAHGLHPTALWNRFNGEDSLWKPWYPMDSDTTLSRLMGRE